MFKAIWKGVTWFFKQPDNSKLPVRSKPMFSRPGNIVNVGTNVKVNRNIEGEAVAGEAEQVIINSYKAMVELTGTDMHAIELAQAKRYGPQALSDADIDYILKNSDITYQQENVVKAINLALNFQYARFSAKIEEWADTLEKVIDKDKPTTGK